jgi:AAA family ATP:ADP antiporter
MTYSVFRYKNFSANSFSEIKKFLPLAILMFCILFNQNILRILKDSILISEVSAEVTSFVKVYCLTPAATFFVVIYAYMVNRLSFEQIFTYLTLFFVGFFAIFGFIIFPNIEYFHMSKELTERLMNEYPNFKWYIALLSYWSYVVFFVLSELWPNVFYILLFWQFANSITNKEEAKKYYIILALIGNSSLIIVGLVLIKLSSGGINFFGFNLSSESEDLLIKYSTYLIVFFGFLSIVAVKYICANVLPDPSLYKNAKTDKKPKEKLGLVDSFKYIIKSKYLWLMLICSASFGLTINLVEAVWKSKIKELYPSIQAHTEFASNYIIWTGIAIMLFTVIGQILMRKFSWYVSAVIAPIVMISTGVPFFAFVVFDEALASMLFGLSPLVLAVTVGTIQNVFSKGVKYSIWDTSREMLYIPLDEELKTKGKAAVDVTSSKLGKAFSGLVQSLLFTIFPNATYTSISPFLMIFFVIMSLVWIYAVKLIYEEYQKIA